MEILKIDQPRIDSHMPRQRQATLSARFWVSLYGSFGSGSTASMEWRTLVTALMDAMVWASVRPREDNPKWPNDYNSMICEACE